MSIYNLQEIVTPRIILRPVQSGDEIALNAAVNRSLKSLQKWMPWAKDPSLAATQNFVHASTIGWENRTGNNFPMAVIYKETQQIIGTSGFNEDSIISAGIYTIGYWLDIAFQGQGLVTEFVNGLTRYALDGLEAKAVHIQIDTANHKSISVANRLGFIPTLTTDQEQASNTILFKRVNTCLLPPIHVTWHTKNVQI
ncbi:MAG: GNAT family N-acetyltransferase [Candidatus Amoebophilus sp.]